MARLSALPEILFKWPVHVSRNMHLIVGSIMAHKKNQKKTQHSKWAQKIDLFLSIIFEARALMTSRSEPRHWISMVSGGMKSTSSPHVSTALFLQVVLQLLHC